MNREEILELSDERAQWEAYALSVARRMYEAGYAAGRADEARDADRLWAAARPRPFPVGPSIAELELRRWGPGGREHFGDPRPGDRMPLQERVA